MNGKWSFTHANDLTCRGMAKVAPKNDRLPTTITNSGFHGCATDIPFGVNPRGILLDDRPALGFLTPAVFDGVRFVRLRMNKHLQLCRSAPLTSLREKFGHWGGAIFRTAF